MEILLTADVALHLSNDIKYLETKQMKNKIYFPMQIKNLSTDDEDNFIFEGHAAVFGNKDFQDDVIVSGAFQKSLDSSHKVKILWMHKMDTPIGVPVELREDNKGLFIKGKLPKDDEFVVKRVMPQMRAGSLELSVGIRVEDKHFEDNKRFIEKAFLAEISLVSMGANPEAQITSFKVLDIDSIKKLDVRDMEKMFLNGFKASHSVAKLLVSLIKNADIRCDVEKSEQREVGMIQDMEKIKYKKIMGQLAQIKNRSKNND